jgi:hypothetical protein
MVAFNSFALMVNGALFCAVAVSIAEAAKAVIKLLNPLLFFILVLHFLCFINCVVSDG